MNDFALPLVFVLFVLLVIVSVARTFSRSHTILDRWAAENGLTILNQEYRPLRMGPFFFRHAKGQTVYYVTVQDGGGNIRRGWVRCGGWFVGLVSDTTKVEWDN